MPTLTKRQKEILDFIKFYIKKNGYSPTFEEIKKKFRLKALSGVHQHIEALIRKGYIEKNDNSSRGMELKKSFQDYIQIPLVGLITAGQPIEAIEERGETIAVPRLNLPISGECFALRIVGDSMVDEDINDGDIILVKQQQTASNGQKVVALIDNHEATLKKFYKERSHIRLEPANKKIEPIILKKDTPLSIQGIFVDVIRKESDNKVNKAKVAKNKKLIKSKKDKAPKRKLVNKLNDLNASEWIPETVSVYVQKGLGRGHKDTKIEMQHPAPYSFQDVGRLIRFFTKKGQKVLDPFVGVGSTLKACVIESREGVGIELVRKYVDLSKQRLKDEVQPNLFGAAPQKIICGDALKIIKKLPDDDFDFIVTSPPYWNILNKKADHKVKQERISNGLDTKYSDDSRDLGNINEYDKFIEVLSDFFNSCSRILKPKKYISIIVSDFRHKDRFYMFHSDLASRLEAGNFVIKGITILYQKHKKVFPYGYPYAYVPNIHHQYILIFQNKKN